MREEMKPLYILFFSLSLFGNILVGKCLYVSNQVSDSICEQHQKYTDSGELQKPAKSGVGSGSENDLCGWYQVKKGKEAGCAASIASFIECRIIEQRQSPDFNKRTQETQGGGGRIVGGEDAAEHEFKSVVAYVPDNSLECGATLISPSWVVTAAHCVNNLDRDRVVIAGQFKRNDTDEQNPTRQTRKVVEFKIHEKYDAARGDFQFDIALFKVDPPFELNENIKAVTLPDPAYRADGDFTVIGWGFEKQPPPGSGDTRPNNLKKAIVSFTDDETCNKTYSGEGWVVRESMLCAGGGAKDACGGDSGGPLYKIDGDKETLVGITSWGDCGDAEPPFPGVYTETAYYIDWIKTNTCM